MICRMYMLHIALSVLFLYIIGAEQYGQYGHGQGKGCYYVPKPSKLLARTTAAVFKLGD